MRKSMFALAGAAALALSSAAGATVTVTGTTNLNNPDPAAPGSIQTVGNTTTINFGLNPVMTPTFTSSFNIVNTVAGMYSILVGTSSPTVTFSSATLTGPGTCSAGCALTSSAGGKVLTLTPPISLLAGTYAFVLNGADSAAPGGSFTGNVTITPSAVPEAGTWAMMLLGFGAIGMTVRSRRRPVLAQLA